MKKIPKYSYLINFIGVLAVFGLLAAIFESGIFGTRTTYFMGICTTACYTIIMVASLNLVVGCMGEFSLGHAGFVSVGAYASAIVSAFSRERGCRTWRSLWWPWRREAWRRRPPA